MLIGAHVSIAGGMDLSIERAELIGANCIQTFASSPRTLKFLPLDDEVVNRYLDKREKSGVELHVFHGIYLVNLANEKSDYVRASIDSLVYYQQTAKSIGALGTIFHIGSHKGIGFDSVKHQVAEAIKTVISESPEGVKLILENAAGHRGTIGQTVEELAELFNIVNDQKNLGLCLDTQHAFASGVDGRKAQAIDSFLEEVDREIGLDYLKVIHTNDSKVEFDSGKDRHENIGEGHLGNMGIGNWVNHPKLKGLPFILEVPGLLGKGPGKEDVNKLRQLWKS